MASTPPTPTVIPASFTSYALTPMSGGVNFDTKQKAVTIVKGLYSYLATNTFAFIAGSGYPIRGNTGTPPDAGFSGTWIIEEANLKKERGGVGTLTINWLGNSFLPPDNAWCEPTNENPRIERNPLFNTLDASDIIIARNAAEASNALLANNYQQQFANTSDPVKVTLLYNLLIGGWETYYRASFRFKWEKYYDFGSAPATDSGGYIQSPATSFGGAYAPNVGTLPLGFAYLREADSWNFVGGLQSVVKFTRSWLGGYGITWNTDIY